MHLVVFYIFDGDVCQCFLDIDPCNTGLGIAETEQQWHDSTATADIQNMAVWPWGHPAAEDQRIYGEAVPIFRLADNQAVFKPGF